MRRMQVRRWSRVRDGLKKVFAIAMITQQLTPPPDRAGRAQQHRSLGGHAEPWFLGHARRAPA